jgi:iron complex outermembrane recepter protein
MLQRKRNLLSTALASAIVIAVPQAYAQDSTAPDSDDATELDRVRVTGIRGGIERSLDTKQTATSIVEAISAEDIGKLPDASIADSIARLPGLTAQRERGRATQINIRGLSGDFAGTTLNGREQANTGDNRGVEFDQYPSELLSQAVIYKTPDARLVGQGLSGTIDMRTARPLDFSERVMAVNARYDINEVEDWKETGNRYSFSYIDQFMDDRIGLAFGYSHLDSPQPNYQNETWGYADSTAGAPLNGNNVFGGGKVYRLDERNERDGAMLTLQFRPGDIYESALDVFYSKFDRTQVKSGVEFGTAWGTGTLLPGYTANGTGTITDSRWTGVTPVLRADSNPIQDTLTSVGWNNKWQLNENWTLTQDLSFSNVKRNSRYLETYVGLASGTSDLRVELDPAGFNRYTFSENLNDPNNLRLVDAGNWAQDGYLKDFEVTDRITAGRVDLTRTFDQGMLQSLSFGVNQTQRTKEKSSLEYKLCLQVDPGNPADCLAGATAPFPGVATDFSFAGIDGLANFDAETLLRDGTYQLVRKDDKDISNKNWGIREKVDTVYVQANLDTDIGQNMALRGNLGVQWVRADQNSRGVTTINGAPVGDVGTSGDTYSHVLPSLNLSLEFPDEYYLRFGASRQMQRPRMDDMRASVDVSICTPNQVISTNHWCGGGGNPKLKPWLANGYDLSLEKYFTTAAGNKGFIGAAYFYKDLKNYIYNDTFLFDYSGYALPPPSAGQVNYPPSTVGTLNGRFNGEGGTLRGYEASFSVPLDLLWGGLDGFGLLGSYSVTDTSISPNGPGTSERLPGWSKYVSNVTAYYERAGFSIRLSQRTRSNFRGESRGFGADLGYEDFLGEKVQDAQVNYEFQHGPLQGLSLYLQFSNLGDEPFRSFDSADSESRPLKYFSYGKTTLIGFGYRF